MNRQSAHVYAKIFLFPFLAASIILVGCNNPLPCLYLVHSRGPMLYVQKKGYSTVFHRKHKSVSINSTELIAEVSCTAL